MIRKNAVYLVTTSLLSRRCCFDNDLFIYNMNESAQWRSREQRYVLWCILYSNMHTADLKNRMGGGDMSLVEVTFHSENIPKAFIFQFLKQHNLQLFTSSAKKYEPGNEKMCLMSYVNNKGADHPAHPRSLISAFVVRCLDSIISLDSIAKISRL